MIRLRVHVEDDMQKEIDKCSAALKGCRAFIENEVMVTSPTEGTDYFEILLCPDNKNVIGYDVIK